ncbi:MAG: TerC family protein [Planctomycetota bacterium]|jgi:predicted tellurium resistance membrane protein TerC
MEWIAQPEAWIALTTLTALEIVLGIDNIIFISILTGRLPEHQQEKARKIGLLLAMGMRIALLFCLTWIMGLTEPFFSVLGQDFSGRSLILLTGGLFLIGKATVEIHHRLGEVAEGKQTSAGSATYKSVLFQILLLDIVFSVDSVITAVGMVEQLSIMVTAVVISVLCMIFFVGPVCRFVEKNPTFKILALSFLLLIGMALVGEGLEMHIPKGYIYFAMGFSVFVEVLNMKVGRKSKPLQLQGPHLEDLKAAE